MEHIGIDLGSRHSHIVVIGRNGKVSYRGKVYTVDLPDWFRGRAASHVIMEACTQSPAIARAALAADHETKVVPGHLVRLLGVGARGIKTDDRDAEALARASSRNPELPTVHLRSEQSQDRKELIAARANLLGARSSLIVSVKSWLRGRLTVPRGRANHRSYADKIRQLALAHPDGLPMGIEAMLTSFEQLTDQIELLDAEIENVVSQDEVCQRLMTIPGVGPQVALSFICQVDDPARFRSSEELASYMGLVTGENTTGGNIVRTSTIKAGPKRCKSLLVQAAWVMKRTRPNDPAVLWVTRLAERRKPSIAIIALARKMATIMWSMWKHGTTYNPARASSVRLPNSTQPISAAAE